MKRSKLLMAGGTLILAFAAIFASKANKKYFSITTARIGATGSHYVFGNSSIFTATNTGNQLKVMLYTGSHLAIGSSVEGALFTVGGSEPVFHQ